MDADTSVQIPSGDLQGRYIDAPVWPWAAAGWTLGIVVVLSFFVAWVVGRA